MNNTLSKIIIFTAGAVIGSAVTWKLVKTKYEQLAQEEINSVRDYYSCREADKNTEEDSAEESDETDTGMEEYEQIVRGANYVAYQNEKLKEGKEVYGDYIKLIDPDEYGESDFATESLDYYEGDGVLVDAYGDVIDDPDEIVGEDFASHFGAYGERDKDTVFIRNEKLEIDYEILRNVGSYSEVE